MRANFNEIFTLNSGMITPLRRVRIGGVEFGSGVSFNSGVSFGGINLSQFTQNDFEVEERAGVWVIKGIYGVNNIQNAAG
ncbi:MAG: hypothetical protein WC304_04085 [Candidatus Gracilibacteria bacterium]|jgi:hypothetical protein